MAMVLQANRMTNNDSSPVSMDSYQSLHRQNGSTSSSPPRSASPISTQDDSFRRMIFEKVEEGKRDLDPQRCTKILEDLMKMLKHLTADVNKYNLAFRESRPAFYMQEFERLTDHIDILTKARDTLTEYLHEVADQNLDVILPPSSPMSDVSSTMSHQSQNSPSEKISHQQKLSLPSSPFNSKDIVINDYSTSHDSATYSHSFIPSSPLSSPNASQQHTYSYNTRGRRPSMTPNHFIRVHFPNKHTTALAPRSDETLEVALESRASRHSVTNLRAYTPVYLISRQPCPWDITLDRLLENEIELEEKTKLDHSFIRKTFFTLTYCDTCHKLVLQGLRCLVCGYRIHTRCIHKFRLCRFEPQDIFYRHIKHFSPNRFDIERLAAPSKTKEQSRSLPRIPPPKLNISVNYGVDDHQTLIEKSNVQSFCHETRLMVISAPSETSNSLLQRPVSTSHLPQFLLTVTGPPVTSPDIPRSNSIKTNNDSPTDVKKPVHKHVSEWEIRSEDLLSRGRMVGRGTYGTVYKAEVRLHGLVALKELNFVSPTPSQFQAFRNEVLALKKITHQNTLNFYGYILSPRFAIVTQWCDGSTLYKHIHILDRHWKINQLIDIARQICQGMSYLHDRGIIHRDLKSSNVFLDMCAETDDAGVCWRVKIGDFGLAAVKSVLTEGVNQPSQPTGSILWMSPEVIQQKDPNCYSNKADVYAYGCVLFEMFSGKLPHTPINNKEQIMWLVGKGRLKLKVEQCRDDTPAAITDLIRQCTEYDYEKRPNFAPEIDDTLSKFDCILPRLQRSQSEPCIIRTPPDDLLGLSIHYGVPKTPVSIHRRFNAEVS